MKKIVIIVGSLLIAANAYASSNWIFVVSNVNKTEYYIDSNSTQRSGDSTTFWQIANFNSKRTQDTLSMKTQVTINCRSREIISRYILAYDDIDGNGRLVWSGKGDLLWEPIAPDTVDWHMMKFVCK